MMGENALLIIAVIVIAGVALAMRSGKGGGSSNNSGGSSSEPQGWSFYGLAGTPPPGPAPHGSGGCIFTFPSTDGVHYVTKPIKATTSFRAAGQVDVSDPVAFDFPREGGRNTGTTPANFGLFFQRWDDSMSGAGPYQFYRWWSTKRIPCAGGAFDVTASLANPAEWTSVNGVSGDKAPAEFAAAIANMRVAGLTFGGGNVYGHGVFVPVGSATFQLLSFTAQ